MSRPRGDPARIYQAQRYGIFRRLVDEQRVAEAAAERWITAWEQHAEAIGLHRGTVGYWDRGWEWMAEQRSEGGGG